MGWVGGGYQSGDRIAIITTTHHMSYHTISYSTMPYHTIPYHTIPYHTIPYHTIPYHTITPCYNLIGCTMNIVDYDIISYNMMQTHGCRGGAHAEAHVGKHLMKKQQAGA